MVLRQDGDAGAAQQARLHGKVQSLEVNDVRPQRPDGAQQAHGQRGGEARGDGCRLRDEVDADSLVLDRLAAPRGLHDGHVHAGGRRGAGDVRKRGPRLQQLGARTAPRIADTAHLHHSHALSRSSIFRPIPRFSRPPFAMPPLGFHALDIPPDEAPRRIREARARGLPRWLWPELPVPLWRAATAEVVRATGKVLAGRAAVLDGEGRMGAQALGIAAFLTGTGPLLGHWIERGALAADGDAADLFALHLAHGRARAERMGRVLDDALAALAAAGVQAILVKGIATSRTLFPEPGARPMGDMDLVVPPAAIDAAERALAGAGFTRLAGDYERRPYHADWRPPDGDGAVHSLSLLHRDNPLALNLRDGLDRYSPVGHVRFGWPAPGDTVPPTGLRSPARALVGPFLVAHLAAHAGEQRESLLLIRLVELVLAFRAGVDPAALDAFLRERRMPHRVYPAIALAERLAPGTVDARLMRSLAHAAGPRLRRTVAALDLGYLQRLDQPVAGGHAFASRGAADDLRAALRRLVPFTSPARLAQVYRTRLLRLFRAG